LPGDVTTTAAAPDDLPDPVGYGQQQGVGQQPAMPAAADFGFVAARILAAQAQAAPSVEPVVARLVWEVAQPEAIQRNFLDGFADVEAIELRGAAAETAGDAAAPILAAESAILHAQPGAAAAARTMTVKAQLAPTRPSAASVVDAPPVELRAEVLRPGCAGCATPPAVESRGEPVVPAADNRRKILDFRDGARDARRLDFRTRGRKIA